MIQELPVRSFNGFTVAGILLVVALILGLALAVSSSTLWTIASATSLAPAMFLLIGFYNVHPNQAQVLQLFGRYVGSDRNSGLRWANPLYTKTAVSLRVRNFESSKLKVNDANGNPIEIAAVVVWRVVESAEAVFEVDNYENYVTIQSEAALRNLATSYP
ncbi:MAG: SPFH domain-containing protein, partial [Pseudomonadales bacterium]|nr:SPFH domain-containing protein [Pseudomonadales bacterium]